MNFSKKTGLTIDYSDKNKAAPLRFAMQVYFAGDAGSLLKGFNGLKLYRVCL